MLRIEECAHSRHCRLHGILVSGHISLEIKQSLTFFFFFFYFFLVTRHFQFVCLVCFSLQHRRSRWIPFPPQTPRPRLSWSGSRPRNRTGISPTTWSTGSSSQRTASCTGSITVRKVRGAQANCWYIKMGWKCPHILTVNVKWAENMKTQIYKEWL